MRANLSLHMVSPGKNKDHHYDSKKSNGEDCDTILLSLPTVNVFRSDPECMAIRSTTDQSKSIVVSNLVKMSSGSCR